MEKLVEEIQFQVPFKETTEVGDTVLMLREDEDGQLIVAYARVMGFTRDETKRDEWWHVHFVFFEMPPAPRTIILQTPHFTGREIFTMGGRKVFIKAVNLEILTEGGGPKKEPARPPRKPQKPTFTLVK